ncbi:MAG: hypothetical protein ACR2KT_12925 [Methylocella sp.]
MEKFVLDEPAGNEKNACGGHANARSPVSCRHAFAIGLAILGLGQIARAADALPPPQAAESAGVAEGVTDYFAEWFERVDAISAAQPSWAAPLTTVTPLLKEFVMYGQAIQTLPNGANVTISDGGMPAVGIHLIPDYYNEIYIGAPPYQVRTIKQPADASPTCRFFSSKRGWLPVTQRTAIMLSVPISPDRRRSASRHLQIKPIISRRRSPPERAGAISTSRQPSARPGRRAITTYSARSS